MLTTEIKNNVTGLVGFLHSLEQSPDSVLVFQLPRPTNMLSDIYVAGAMKNLKEVLPDGKKALLIGADVNIYEIAGHEATMLVLKGVI